MAGSSAGGSASKKVRFGKFATSLAHRSSIYSLLSCRQRRIQIMIYSTMPSFLVSTLDDACVSLSPSARPELPTWSIFCLATFQFFYRCKETIHNAQSASIDITRVPCLVLRLRKAKPSSSAAASHEKVCLKNLTLYPSRLYNAAVHPWDTMYACHAVVPLKFCMAA